MKKAFSTIFTLIIICVSIYFFYQYEFWIGVLLLIWGITRMLGYNFEKIYQGANLFQDKKNPNIQIDVLFNVAAVIEHPIFDEVFDKIKTIKEKTFSSVSKDWKDKINKGDIEKIKKTWRANLIENYKKKYKNQYDETRDGHRYIWEKVKFNIKNNILWRNNEVFFGDIITYDISIPYEYKGEDDFSLDHFPDDLQIRLQVVNGMMKLQVGNFDKSITPKMLKDDGLAVYQTWYTVSSLPLMYMDYGIPTHYLNPCAEAMDSYWQFWHSGKTNNEDKEKWAKEWRQINQDIRDYEYISSKADDESLDNQSMKIIGEFGKKLKAYREQEGENLKSNRDKSEDEGYVPAFLQDDDTEFTNNYLHVSVLDFNSVKESKGRYAFSDYWEEHP